MDKPLRLEPLLQRRPQGLWTNLYPWKGCETAGPWMSYVFSWNQFFSCKSMLLILLLIPKNSYPVG